MRKLLILIAFVFLAVPAASYAQDHQSPFWQADTTFGVTVTLGNSDFHFRGVGNRDLHKRGHYSRRGFERDQFLLRNDFCKELVYTRRRRGGYAWVWRYTRCNDLYRDRKRKRLERHDRRRRGVGRRGRGH